MRVLIGLVGFLTLVFFGVESTLRNKIIGKLKYVLFPPKEESPDGQSTTYVLPPEGQTVSVEKALNSRCTSDYSANQKYHHWGMFDNTKKLTGHQIDQIVALTEKIPRFTQGRVETLAKGNMLTFSIEDVPPGIQRDWMMVESGMQQQAAGLVCAALGIGMVFKNLGIDGRPLDNGLLGTVREKLNPMIPSYEGSYWHAGEPAGRRPWMKGNLPDPVRDGEVPLLSALSDLDNHRSGRRKATAKDASQLLWAARGRTPHLYKSKPWGMTIPFWSDRIQTSCLHLIQRKTVYKYENWTQGRPTHSTIPMREADPQALQNLRQMFEQKETFIILSRIDQHARAIWEVGYQLINIMLQAYALDVDHQAALCGVDQRKLLEDMQIGDSIAIVAT